MRFFKNRLTKKIVRIKEDDTKNIQQYELDADFQELIII